MTPPHNNDSTDATRDFLTGKLLIAMPNMGDPRFEKSVIFLCGHDAEHAMGVIVNKPVVEIDIVELLTQLDIKPRQGAEDIPVFYGGPVQTDRGLVIHSLDYSTDDTIILGQDIGLSANREILIDIAGAEPVRAAPRQYLLAIGHAGWAGDQLENEIAMNAWAHCESDEALIFGGAQNDVWKRSLAKLGVTGAMLSPEWSETRSDDGPIH